MTLREVSEQTGIPYSTLHGHIKSKILIATRSTVNNREHIDISEEALTEYLKHEELRDLMTNGIMSIIMQYVDSKMGESLIDTMSDDLNDSFQLKIESGVAYLLRELKC